MEQKRVILWGVPRSVSTAFFRAMMCNKKCKALLEPLSTPYYLGPDKASARYTEDDIETRTIWDALDIYRQPFEGYDVVFAKDMAYYLTGKLDDLTYIPKGYTHTFLIRHPAKSLLSLYKICVDPDKSGWTTFDPREAGFEQIHRLYTLLSSGGSESIIIIDVDDLLGNPERYIREYCRRTEIPFLPEMLDWDKAQADTSIFQEWLPWFQEAATTSGFKQPSVSSSKPPETLPEEVQEEVQRSLPFYTFLYEKRLRLEDCPPVPE